MTKIIKCFFKWFICKLIPNVSFALLYTLLGFFIASSLYIPQIENAVLDPRCNNPNHYSAPEKSTEDSILKYLL